MRLYELDWGLYPRRVLIYLAEKGITDIERVPVDLMSGANRSPEFLAINPAGTVPVLEVEPGAYIRQSISIMEYLEEIYPEPNMIGRTALARARTRDLNSMIAETYVHFSTYAAHASPVFQLRVTEQKADAAATGRDNFVQALCNLENVIGDGEFIAGNHPTIADCALFASADIVTRLYRQTFPNECVRLQAWYERFSRRPSAAPIDYPEVLKARAPIPS